MGIYQNMMNSAVRIKRILTGNDAQTGYMTYLEKLQYKTPEELKSLQAVSLCELMKHAVEHIPYYMKYKALLKLEPETIFDDIRSFPIIHKSDLIEKRNEFIADNIKIITELSTAGTLGNKALMAMDQETGLSAPDEFFNKMIGIIPGKSRLILKADDRSKAANTIGGFDYNINKISRSYRVDHRHMNNEKINFIINIFQKRKPEIVWGNTHGAYVLAKYIENNNIRITPPELFLCGGQIMLPQYAETIERAFSSKVYDRYGSVESGNTANQCKNQDGYHYVPVVHYIEILDKDLNPVREGETGNLYLTTITKRAMPVIRYDIGDLAEFTGKTCSCGCNFPIIKQIHGRRKEGIISPSGTYLSLSPLNLIINQSDEIRDFQMIQTAPDSLLIKVIGNIRISENPLLEKIKQDINRSLDYNMNIEFKCVNNLKALANGKMLRIIPLDRQKELGGIF